MLRSKIISTNRLASDLAINELVGLRVEAHHAGAVDHVIADDGLGEQGDRGRSLVGRDGLLGHDG